MSAHAEDQLDGQLTLSAALVQVEQLSRTARQALADEHEGRVTEAVERLDALVVRISHLVRTW